MSQTCFHPNEGLAETAAWMKQVCFTHDTAGAVTATTVTTVTTAVPPAFKATVPSPTDMNNFWLFICAVLVFFMQAGFAMLEVGAVRAKNSANILMKNIMDISLACISFWLFGYAFAYGDSKDAKFIGDANFALVDNSSGSAPNTAYAGFFFQVAFAATASTIVSGCVAERTKLPAYFIYTIVLTTFIYPVVVHWVWDSEGWLSAFRGAGDRVGTNGLFDFAGSGVVHMVGGFAGLCGAFVAGKRQGCEPKQGVFPAGAPQSPVFCALGVIILWVGWYGFNCGSTLAIVGASELAAKVAVTTTIAAASAAITCCAWSVVFRKKYDLMLILNGVLAGLVSITAPCCIVEPWAAMMIGFIGALVFIGSSALVKAMDIDDPLDAGAVHGFCGAWGVIACGIFGEDGTNVMMAYSRDNDAIESGEQLAVQIAGVAVILAWTIGTSLILFFGINLTIGMRVSEDVESKGLDISEHGINIAENHDMGRHGYQGSTKVNGKNGGPPALEMEQA